MTPEKIDQYYLAQYRALARRLLDEVDEQVSESLLVQMDILWYTLSDGNRTSIDGLDREKSSQYIPLYKAIQTKLLHFLSWK